ncbi:MAG: YihY family inner membrane protein [Pseudoxanthomonas suwonensis]|nr:YihY family inner membrane protein [Pseudoxanthomonas suwonensis]
MRPAQQLQQWQTRLRDPARARSFGRFLWRRFLDDRLFEAAGALSYTTVFALVPLSMVVLGILSAFPGFHDLQAALLDFIFSNFVPSAADGVKKGLAVLQENIPRLTTAGVIGLVLSLLVTLNSVETTFNRIWRVSTARPQVSRFLVYWTVLTLGTLIAAASIALSSRLFALAIFETGAGRFLEHLMLSLAPLFIELLCFTAIFRVVPHRTVKWRHALAGGMLSVLLFELIKWGVGLYLASFKTYQILYGALAALPILMLWIYLTWIAVLLGASFAAAISAFRYQPAAMRLPLGYEMYGLLRMLGRMALARRQGLGLHSEELQRLDPMLTDNLVQDFLGALDDANIVSRAESGEWVLARDLSTLTLAQLYEACHLRVPITEAHLPCRDDALGQVAAGAIDELRLPLRDALKRRVSDLYEELEA